MDQNGSQDRVHDESDNSSEQQTEGDEGVEDSIDENEATKNVHDEPEAVQPEPKKDIGKKFPWKLLFDSIAVLVAVVAIFISIRGCQISQKANENADNAIAISMRQFIQTNRPYLIVEPEKRKDGQFWKLEQRGKDVLIAVEFKITNVGNVTADHIMTPDVLQIKSKKPLNRMPTFSKVGDDLFLAPTDHYFSRWEIVNSKESVEEAVKGMKEYASEDYEGLEVGFSVFYQNSIDKSQRYGVNVSYRIKKDIAIILKSEMINLSEMERK